MRKSTFFFDRLFRMFGVIAGFFVVCVICMYLSTFEGFVLPDTKKVIIACLAFGYMFIASATLLLSQKHK